MTVIYGLREVGSAEIRYIGRSAKPLPERLHKHQLNAAKGYPPLISQWIKSAGEIEIVALQECSADLAYHSERRLAEQYHADGHRLVNSHLVPRQTGAAA